VHAFAEGEIGYYFLAFIAIALLFSLALLAGRSSELRAAGTMDGVASRETVFLFNNLILTAFTFTVLLGTLYPLVAEALRGVKVSVGAPFFNRMTVPLCVSLLFLMGVGPALPWRRASREVLRRQLLPPTVAALVVALVSVVLGLHAPYSVMGFAFGAFALVANLREYATGISARMRAHGEGAATALARLVAANRRRYGGYVSHLGVIALAVGIVASSTFRNERDATLAPGQIVDAPAGGYQLRFDELWAQDEPQRFVVAARVAVLKGGKEIGQLDPRLNFYRGTDQPIATPAVRSRPTLDIYVNLMAFERDGSSATLRVLTEPLVFWIWFGGLVVGLGALIALWPERRRRTATAPRAAAPVPVAAGRE
jgi:cytochrome c-type biogenesis protein CcmF